MENKLDSTKYCYKPSDAIIKYVVADVLELLDNERERVVELERKIKELTELTENGYTADEVREYYLNSGFPRYNEEPFLSEYNDIDWIEHANESELEL